MLILWLIDPLGVVTNADQASAALFYRIVAPAYPAPYGDPKNMTPLDDKTQIAVIVINDESLANIRVDPKTHAVETVQPEIEPERVAATWPPSMSIHARILQKIFEVAEPKAVFIDFGFFDKRDAKGLAEFAEVLGTYAVPREDFRPCLEEKPRSSETNCADWGGLVPIFLPGAGANAPKNMKVLEELATSVTAIVSSEYIGEEFESANLYDVYDCGRVEPSAALAMYVAGGNEPRFRAADCDAKKTPERLSVYWSDWGNAERGRGAYPCRSLPTTVLGRLFRIIGIWFQDGIAKVGLGGLAGSSTPAKDSASQFQTCPPHLTATAQDFLSDETGEMAAVLDDRYVFYGGNFIMADDLIRPPTHDPIPGVYVHAMVLDNLLRGEEKYGGSTIIKALLTVLAIGLSAFSSAWAWKCVSSGREREVAAVSSGATQRELPPLVLQLERLSRWWTGVWRRSRNRFWVAGKPFFWLWALFAILRGFALCLFFILALASVAFFTFDLAPINYAGIFTFVVLQGLGRAVEFVIDEVS